MDFDVDVAVSRLLKTLGAERHADRCAELLEIMDVNPNWHMNAISCGQRRRVQIILGLLEPWDLLLLDEVTVDLDVLVRSDLLAFLKKECDSRKATILYATHIFDGLGGWPTHVAHMSNGSMVHVRDVERDFPEMQEAVAQLKSRNAYFHNSALLLVVEKWLRDDTQQTDREKGVQLNELGQPITKWDILSENMKAFGDKYYNYWR